MGRKKMYKNHQQNVNRMRDRRRQEMAVLRKEKRDQVLNAKRVRLQSRSGEDGIDDISVEQVVEACDKLQQKDTDRLSVLKFLRKAFGQGTTLIDTFLGVENALQTVIGDFTGTDSSLQLEAAWCITNISTGTTEHEKLVLKEAGGYLVTYLSSDTPSLQDQCAWALGNIAGGDNECRSMVVTQGALKPLLGLIKSPNTKVARSAGFALSNLARGGKDYTQPMVDDGILDSLASLLVYSDEKVDLIVELSWILTYLAAGGEYEAAILKAGLLEKLVDVIVTCTNEDVDNYKVLTPSLRCLGNICSGPDTISAKACENKSLLSSLGRLLGASVRHIIKKEALWVLSNITANSEVCKSAVTEGLIPSIVSLLPCAVDIKREAAFCLCNICSHGAEYCEACLQCDSIPGMVPLLNPVGEPDVVDLALSFVEMIARNTEGGKKAFEEAGGLNAMDPLEYHNNEPLRLHSQHILENYFYNQPDSPVQASPEQGKGDQKMEA